MQLSIIIVNYNTCDFLKNCLNSIIEQTKDIEYEILVSDNGSTDSSLEMLKKDFPTVRIIENGQNLGLVPQTTELLMKLKVNTFST